ncbi:MAG: ATP-binding protein [Clostridia bacterium]|nr:ATP-binding protein [Clostridia bacterium]
MGVQERDGLYPRPDYLSRLSSFANTEPIKVITGIRRCGKSSLMLLMQQQLLAEGVAPEQIVSMNFESMKYRNLTVQSFYKEVIERRIPGKRMYLFFDELQRMKGWEDAVNSFRVDLDCDIYITGSNAYLLSSEYATYLAGRYVEIKMLPLSFREYVQFRGYHIQDVEIISGDTSPIAYNKENQPQDWNMLLDQYIRYGGMPGAVELGTVQHKAFTLLDGIYNTVVMRDILGRERNHGKPQITEPELLQRIVMFLADNIGNETSFNTIAKALVEENLIEYMDDQKKPAVSTISAYVRALTEAYLFYPVRRYDIKGKEELKSLGKYYIVDCGLRNYLLGYRNLDTGHTIENIVFLELLRRGYDVKTGKNGTKEVDFIATSDEEVIYYQVTEDLSAESTRKRELEPLLNIRDHYPKVVIALSAPVTAPVAGIRIVRLIDFLLERR